jgi:hypothetical protein
MKGKHYIWLIIPVLLCSCVQGEAIDSTSESGDLHLFKEPSASSMSLSSFPALRSSTLRLYQTFAKHFLTDVLSLSAKKANVNYSLIDAFFDYGIQANIATGSAQKKILSAFGDAALDDVNSAAKDLRGQIGVVQGKKEDASYGSMLLNSVFYGTDLSLAEGADALADTLVDCYGLFLFHDNPTVSHANRFLEDKTPTAYFSPYLFAQGVLPNDEAKQNALSFSAFSYYAHFAKVAEARNKSAYEAGLTMDFLKNGETTTKVPFLYDSKEAKIEETSDYCRYVSSLGTAFFKSKNGISPFDFLLSAVEDDVQKGEMYNVTATLPFFSINQTTHLPLSGVVREGYFKGLLQGLSDEAKVLTYQQNNLTFDYRGIASSSLTYTISYSSSNESPYPPYSFALDQSFVFLQNQEVVLTDSSLKASLPLFVGAVLSPEYSA